MKDWIGRSLFVVVVAVVAFVLTQRTNSVVSQTPSLTRAAASQSEAAGTGLHLVSTTLPNGLQQLCVVDAQTKAIAVYQVDPSQGKLELKSVRSIRWDLQMEEFNAHSPLPSELRSVQTR